MYPRSFDDVKWCLYRKWGFERQVFAEVRNGGEKKKDGFENDLDYFQGDRIKDWTISKESNI